jgi:hypothetical protein
MFRAISVRLLLVVVCGNSLAFAQDPPPLEAPASEPQQAKPMPSQAPLTTQVPAPGSANAPAAAGASQAKAMLVIPGVTVPTPRSGVVSGPQSSQLSRPSPTSIPSASAMSPSVPGPSSLGSPFKPPAGAPSQGVAEPSSLSPIPLGLEPLDDDPAPAQNRTGTTASSSDTGGRSSGSSSSEEPNRARIGGRPAPWRLPGFLGRVMGQQPAGSSRDDDRDSESASRTKAKTKSKSEPEADTVVKRRIEQQIRNTLGDKVRSVEVRVSGRNVLIVARATRFWQKRGAQKALESLPALNGLRARVDLGN